MQEEIALPIGCPGEDHEEEAELEAKEYKDDNQDLVSHSPPRGADHSRVKQEKFRGLSGTRLLNIDAQDAQD